MLSQHSLDIYRVAFPIRSTPNYCGAQQIKETPPNFAPKRVSFFFFAPKHPVNQRKVCSEQKNPKMPEIESSVHPDGGFGEGHTDSESIHNATDESPAEPSGNAAEGALPPPPSSSGEGTQLDRAKSMHMNQKLLDDCKKITRYPAYLLDASSLSS